MANFNICRKQWSVNWDLQRNKQNSKYDHECHHDDHLWSPLITYVIIINVILTSTSGQQLEDQHVNHHNYNLHNHQHHTLINCHFLSDVLAPPWVPAILELQDGHIHYWGHLVLPVYTTIEGTKLKIYMHICIYALCICNAYYAYMQHIAIIRKFTWLQDLHYYCVNLSVQHTLCFKIVLCRKTNIPKIKGKKNMKFLFLVENQFRDARSVNAGGRELLEDAGIFLLSLVLRAFWANKIFLNFFHNLLDFFPFFSFFFLPFLLQYSN